MREQFPKRSKARGAYDDRRDRERISATIGMIDDDVLLVGINYDAEVDGTDGYKRHTCQIEQGVVG